MSVHGLPGGRWEGHTWVGAEQWKLAMRVYRKYSVVHQHLQDPLVALIKTVADVSSTAKVTLACYSSKLAGASLTTGKR